MSPGSRSRRARAAHPSRRTAERTVRKRVLAFTRWVRWHGCTAGYAAEALGLKPATVAKWERDWRLDRLLPEPLGRPEQRLSFQAEECILALFALLGPPLSLDTLRVFFPAESAAALERLRRRLKHLCLREERLNLMTLKWLRPGAVWALDFYQPPRPIDGQFPFVLVIRDLASHQLLWALPCPTKELTTVVTSLHRLFVLFGPPLVLKTDNEFDAHPIADVLADFRVQHLLSPPACPRYNGAVEAGIGTLKVRTFFEAARHDRPVAWTCDDLEAGLQGANLLSRPFGLRAPPPHDLWQARRPIAPEERAAFQAAVRKSEGQARERRALLPGLTLDRQTHNGVRRDALALALVDQGLLRFRRRRFTPPFPLRFF